ncbi:hypothetical protein PLICRDRAFT_693828 [Plicaturopsis crispa FD-325 SS-3]|nr:hypothetical protein PLICRDRAFT_693828 [Plicaturopsis crispa FD-325 SS-3]
MPPFGLLIGTERATAFQKSIQDELTRRGFSPDADPVMAEYITIMIINNKTAAQVTGELEDLIGSDYDPSFTDWLFAEAAKGAPESEAPPQASTSAQAIETSVTREPPPHLPTDNSRRPPNGPRTALYQQAINQALPSTSPSAQKRTASARSPSPSGHGPNKSRRMDLPTGPRAMFRDGNTNPHHGGSRSLLDRVGGRHNNYGKDDIQARIDNITNNSPDPNMMMAPGGGFVPQNGMGGPMDMSGMGMGNPMMLQEMMMNQMAMMAQMASTMGMGPQFMNGGGPGFGMPGDMGMFPGGAPNGFQGSPPQQQQHMGGGHRGRGAPRGRGMGRGRGGAQGGPGPSHEAFVPAAGPQSSTQIAAPIPTPALPANGTPSTAAALSASTDAQSRPGFVVPERPQSPTLCKFSLKCTNAHCRYSHPSPVATPESGVVLSNEACDKGKDCKDKDCIKAHVSPAVLNPAAVAEPPKQNGHPPSAPPHNHTSNPTPCRFGAACTRPNCPYTHPTPATAHKSNHFAQQCRFGAGCTRSSCPFQHPEGRVLPTAFHRGLSTTAPLVNVQTPESGSMGGPSHNRSVKFNNVGEGAESVKDRLEKKMKEIEEKKSQAEKAVAEAEAATKKDNNPVAITA